MAHQCFPSSLRMWGFQIPTWLDLKKKNKKKLRTVYAALPLSVPSLCVKLTLVQNAGNARVHEEHRFPDEHCITPRRVTLAWKHTVKAYCHAQLTETQVAAVAPCRNSIFMWNTSVKVSSFRTSQPYGDWAKISTIKTLPKFKPVPCLYNHYHFRCF